MKKIITLFLILSIFLGCCACDNKTTGKQNPIDKVESNVSDTSSEQDKTVLDDLSSEDTDVKNDNLNSQNSLPSGTTSEKTPAITKDRILDGTKIFDGDYNSYYTVLPRDEHPGVVNMDATYEMLVYDFNNSLISSDDIVLTVNNSNVTVIGTTIVIPYSVRKGYEKVIVTVQNKKDTKLKGSYRFDFVQFTENNTFYDDFSSDDGKWGIDPYEPDARLGIIKDGYMEMPVNENKVGIRTAAQGFEQAYGCFSASMKMPSNQSNVGGAFWLFCGSGYIPNEESSRDTCGEIDIIEFEAGCNLAMFTVHWFNYEDYHKENNSRFYDADFNAQQFCTYSVVWTPQKIFWYVNGKLYKTATGVEEGVANGSRPMYMILQSGYTHEEWGFGWNEADVLPATVYVDWVEVYGLEMD